MDSESQAAGRRAVNAQIRELRELLPHTLRSRADRVAVYAVAIGIELGYGDAEVTALRIEAYRNPPPSNLTQLLSKWDSWIRPSDGVGLAEEDALDLLRHEYADPEFQHLIDALARVADRIQPIA